MSKRPRGDFSNSSSSDGAMELDHFPPTATTAAGAAAAATAAAATAGMGEKDGTIDVDTDGHQQQQQNQQKEQAEGVEGPKSAKKVAGAAAGGAGDIGRDEEQQQQQPQVEEPPLYEAGDCIVYVSVQMGSRHRAPASG